MEKQNIEEKILLYVLDHWHSNFTGISAFKIAIEFELPHDNVMRILDKFEGKGWGKQRKDVKMFPTVMDPDSSNFIKSEEIKTSIFFPTRDLLKKDIEKRGLIKKGISEYKLRLHRGDSQIKLYYFKIEVLKKYFDHPEKYKISDSVIGGDILTKDEFYRTLREEEADELTFSSIRYGKRRLIDGSITISVIVHDLSELSDKEQQYWTSFEIDSPNFASDDKDFEKFIRRDFGAEFVDDEDPLMLLLGELHKINRLDPTQPLFSKTENPYLFPPIVNTKKGLSDACSELYKILGPDSLNQEFLEQFLREELSFSEEDFKHKESGRNKSKLELFYTMLNHFQLDELITLFKELKDLRISADHKIINPEISNENYLQFFRSLVQNLYKDIKKLRMLLTELPT